MIFLSLPGENDLEQRIKAGEGVNKGPDTKEVEDTLANNWPYPI